LADVYDAASLAHAFVTACSYNTYSHTFVRGILEQEGTTQSVASVPIGPGGGGVLGIASPLVHTDLGVYQRVLEAVG
jgi:hypothetical protein